MEESKARFTSDVTLDLSTYREYLQLYSYTNSQNLLFRIVVINFCITQIFALGTTHSYGIFLVFIAAFTLLEYLAHRKYRDGGLGYKQMLHQENGNIPHNLVFFRDDGILFRNPLSGNEGTESYESIRQIRESKNLLVLVTDLKLYRVIDKRTLTDGTSEELIAFLRKKSPNLIKKVATERTGRIVRYLQFGFLAFGLVWSILGFFSVPEKLRGQLTNDMPARQMVEELAKLDIPISDRTLDVILLRESNDTKLFPRYPGDSKIFDLMVFEGMGQYDEDTGVWTPSTSGLYWFSLAFEDTYSCYTDFLTGVDAMDEGLTFSGISEDNIWAKLDGERTVTLAFDYRGQSHSITAEDNGEYFDGFVLFELGKILNQDDDPSNLWYTVDNQGVLMYYGTAEETAELERKTGLSFLDPLENRLYS